MSAIQGDFAINTPKGPSTYVAFTRENYAELGEPFPEHVTTVKELAIDFIAMCSRVLERMGPWEDGE